MELSEENVEKIASVLSKFKALRRAGKIGANSKLFTGMRVSLPGRTIAGAKKVGLLSAGAIAATGAISAADSAWEAAVDPVLRAVRLRRTVKENPWLAEHDKGDVKKFFNTLHRFNPHMAADPLVAGSWLKKSLAYKDVGVQTGDVAAMVDISKKLSDRRSNSAIRTAFRTANDVSNLSKM
jgi:hypothetical protein